MEKHYFNEYDIKENDLFIEKVEEPDVVADDYASGTELDLKGYKPQYHHKYMDSNRLDVLPGIQFPPIISSTYRAFFEKNDMRQLEFHPVDLICEEDGSVDTSYYFLNILNNVECLDRKKSDFDLFHPDYDIIVSINKMVLDKTKIGDRDIFRIAEYPTLIVHSNDLKVRIENQNLSGFTFRDIREYRPI